MLLAADMTRALERVRKYNLKFNLRLGLHTGPDVAGVLGLKRFAFDVWRNMVDTASRIESNGVPGLIHLSSEMHRLVRSSSTSRATGRSKSRKKGTMTTFLARPQ